MWQCEWNALKKNMPNKKEWEHDARQQNVNVRDVLCGDRTEGFKSCHKCFLDMQIYYFDIVSLYHTVNALDDYPIRYGCY